MERQQKILKTQILSGFALVYNLKIYSYNFSNTTCSLKFYSNEEATYFDNDIADIHGFTHKANIFGDVVAQLVSNVINGILENIPTAALSKYLSQFQRSPEIPLINCKVQLKLY